MGADAGVNPDLFLLAPDVAPGLAERDTRGDPPFAKAEGRERLAAAVARIDAAQRALWAERRWAVLLVLQGVDTSGKDGAIRHVLSGVNPQGVQVHSFVAPNAEERRHDFLWRIHKAAPPRGVLGVFNRSHYEEVVVPRLRPEVLAAQNLPSRVAGPDLMRHRYEDIGAFERYLARQGTAIAKVFLHVGKEEQRARLLSRLDDPTKHWKFDPVEDLRAHREYDAALATYEDALTATSIPEAPWHVIPADRKWYARLLVAEILAKTMEELHPEPPKDDPEQTAALERARKELEGGD